MSLFVAAYVFSGITFALDAAVLEVEDTVGTARGFDIVSDHYDGLAFVVDIGKNIEDSFDTGGIESAGRFVRKYDIGIIDDRSYDTDSLALTAGQLASPPLT